MSFWYPEAVHDEAPRRLWGYRLTINCPKLVLHTTESNLGVYVPHQGTYYGHNSWPHGTVALENNKWKFFQHIPANFAARALENKSGGVETNNWNTFQIEIATKSKNISELPHEAYVVLAGVLRWLNERIELPLECGVIFPSYPESLTAGVRLSVSKWSMYSGILGHMHVPENSHGDPGDINVEKLINLACGEIVGSQEVQMTDEEFKKLAKIVSNQVRDDLLTEMRSTTTGDPDNPDVPLKMEKVKLSLGSALGLLVLRTSIFLNKFASLENKLDKLLEEKEQ